jgi:hypothetical protein
LSSVALASSPVDVVGAVVDELHGSFVLEPLVDGSTTGASLLVVVVVGDESFFCCSSVSASFWPEQQSLLREVGSLI